MLPMFDSISFVLETGVALATSSDSAILIFGRVLTCTESGVNKATEDFGADINSEFSRRKRDISVN